MTTYELPKVEFHVKWHYHEIDHNVTFLRYRESDSEHCSKHLKLYLPGIAPTLPIWNAAPNVTWPEEWLKYHTLMLQRSYLSSNLREMAELSSPRGLLFIAWCTHKLHSIISFKEPILHCSYIQIIYWYFMKTLDIHVHVHSHSYVLVMHSNTYLIRGTFHNVQAWIWKYEKNKSFSAVMPMWII